jgi:hypothetical protein
VRRIFPYQFIILVCDPNMDEMKRSSAVVPRRGEVWFQTQFLHPIPCLSPYGVALYRRHLVQEEDLGVMEIFNDVDGENIRVLDSWLGMQADYDFCNSSNSPCQTFAND